MGKLNTKRVQDIANRLFVAMPKKRDEIVSELNIFTARFLIWLSSSFLLHPTPPTTGFLFSPSALKHILTLFTFRTISLPPLSTYPRPSCFLFFSYFLQRYKVYLILMKFWVQNHKLKFFYVNFQCLVMKISLLWLYLIERACFAFLNGLEVNVMASNVEGQCYLKEGRQLVYFEPSTCSGSAQWWPDSWPWLPFQVPECFNPPSLHREHVEQEQNCIILPGVPLWRRWRNYFQHFFCKSCVHQETALGAATASHPA